MILKALCTVTLKSYAERFIEGTITIFLANYYILVLTVHYVQYVSTVDGLTHKIYL